MLQKITSRFDGITLYECEADSLLEALQKAVKARADLTRADLGGADLTRADLTGADLYEANLTGADLDGADLTRADLTGANLTGANLTGANLYGANLTRAYLDGADLTRANLDGADLTRANLPRADLTRANLTRANLDGKEVLNIIQLAGIGPERRSMVAIILEDEIAIQCGCFSGFLTRSLDDFRLDIEKTHESNERYLTEYRAAIRWIESCATACRGERKQSKG